MVDPQLKSNPASFFVKDCALAPIATGVKALTLGEFRDSIKIISTESIYFHFWRPSIEASLAPGAFFNDFSHWAHYHLHDDVLAERLALLDPTEYVDLERLREDLVEVVENRIDEQDGIQIAMSSEAFHFVKSKIVVFNTAYKMEHPKDLIKVLPTISISSIFYHFIDARRREVVSLDDFSSWLLGYGNKYSSLVEQLKMLDPYFIPLKDLQNKLTNVVTKYFLDEEKNEGGEE